MANIPDIQEIERYHHKYSPNDKVYDLVYGHCKIVTEIALWCAGNLKNENVNAKLLEAAGLLHDIGSYAFFDNEGRVLNKRLYPQHAILGAKILADEGIDERVTELIASHVLLGLTKQEIIDTPWYLPERDYEPQTIEGEILCYADRFHSKHPTFNAYETFLQRLKRSFPLQAKKFENWSERFGIPDVPGLANKYGQPVR